MSILLHRRLWFLTATLALLALSFFTIAPVRHASAQPNLISNGDFSLGNVGFTTSYTFAPLITGVKVYDIVTDPNLSHPLAVSYGDHTSGTGLMMAVNGSTTSGDVVWSQTINVAPNQTHTFSMFISSWSPTNIAELRVDVNGTPIGSLFAPSTTGEWQQFSATFNPGASSTATIDIVELSTSAGSNDYALDDLEVTGPANQPPDCSNAAPSESPLWPPNHKFVRINVTGVTDSDGDTISINIDSIFQDEPVNGKGDGNTSPDGRGVGTDTAEVRAERAGRGNGRVYEIGYTADDSNGGTCTGSVFVGVPHDKKDTPVNDGTVIDSTVPVAWPSDRRLPASLIR